MRLLNFVALILILLGAINWGLWGFFQFDLVGFLFGSSMTMLARLVYCLIGLAGLWGLTFLGRSCRSGGCGHHRHHHKHH